MTIARIRTRVLLPMAAMLLTLGACDDPVVVDDHFEVEGFALFEGDTEIYRYMLADGAPPTLTLASRAHDVMFVLLDPAGTPIPEDDHGDEDEHELLITIGDTSILTWEPEDHARDEDHDIVVFEGELTGLQAGSTTMEVCVPHDLHCDFEVVVPVTVTGP